VLCCKALVFGLLKDHRFSSIRVANPTICIGTLFAHNLRWRTQEISQGGLSDSQSAVHSGTLP
jgi:hypothetical protein